MSKTSDRKTQQLTFEHYQRPADRPARKRRTDPDQPVLTVTELTRRVREAIQVHLPTTVLVAGEVSNLSRPRSGHVYFTLKDENSQINCVIWSATFKKMKLKFELADGLAVLIEGHVDVYSPRGQYQLYAKKVRPYGLGELDLAFRQLREKLEKEGLFDPAHKKPIPAYPMAIAVVTSISGAAVRDVVRTLNRRWPVGRVMIYPVQVQGEGAAGQIAQALDDVNAGANQLGGIDVIILARGGGSLEDLWAFNEEPVARAIYRSAIPVVTGVGHEVDVTIADLVADLRAATPTAAAERVSPVLNEVLDDLGQAHQILRRRAEQTLTGSRDRLDGLAGRGMFVHPIVLVGRPGQQLDDLTAQLQRLTADIAHRTKGELNRLSIELNKISPHLLIHRTGAQLGELHQRLKYGLKHFIAGRGEMLSYQQVRLSACAPGKTLPLRQQELAELTIRLTSGQQRRRKTLARELEHIRGRLVGCDYRNVLRRGFAVARRADDNRIIRSIAMAEPGATVVTEVCDGKFTSTVEDKAKQEMQNAKCKVKNEE